MTEAAALPTWEEFAISTVRSRLDAERYQQEAIARGDKKEVRQWATQIRKLDAFMAKCRITINRA
jgi:hypothetical protein